ncbi:MAG: YeaH/YhbH family protein [Pseudomonadales bacterium]
MSYIIDRRLNSKNKSTVNRQRFVERYQKQIKRAVDESLKKKSMEDLNHGSDITIARDHTREPFLHQGKGGTRTKVFPGNREFCTGDEFERPQQESGQGAGEGSASNQGGGEDEFTFHISQQEFLDFMFEDLELPYLVKKQLSATTNFETHQAGFVSHSSPEKLHLIRSMRAAYARRIALGGRNRDQVSQLKQQLWALEVMPQSETDPAQIEALRKQIKLLAKDRKHIPFLDTFDLRYRNYVKKPIPSTKAVVICVMDVSGSMTQSIKEMAKRFFILLYLFIERSYKETELVFVRHHTQAKEVDEEEFFYSRETGGTIVSSALELTADIISERYPQEQWNIYVAQASDGDNWDNDSLKCCEIIEKRILPAIQYFAYVEITAANHQNLWHEYQKLHSQHSKTFAMQHVREAADIYPVFRELFSSKLGEPS